MRDERPPPVPREEAEALTLLIAWREQFLCNALIRDPRS
jgi:hypothetical protein